jgi:NADH-quinone oxidoreductase subunit I
VEPELPPRSRGVIGLLEENCTVCMLCARECPDWCIYIDSHKETIPAKEEGARDRTRNVLDRFAIDFSLCMYCGICIEACPFDALFWSPEFEYAELDIRDLVHEKDRLREWMWTVPPPPALDAHAERPKEVDAARKALQGPAGGATPCRRCDPCRWCSPCRGRDRCRRRPAGTDPPPAPGRHRAAAGLRADPRVHPRRARVNAPSYLSPTGAEVVFVVLGIVTLAAAVLVVTTRHLVHAALWLVVALGAIAGCYLVLSAEFVAWVQVLIYVGAVVVLLLFGLMLTRAPIGASDDLDSGPVQRSPLPWWRSRRQPCWSSWCSTPGARPGSSWGRQPRGHGGGDRGGALPRRGCCPSRSSRCCCSPRWSARSCCRDGTTPDAPGLPHGALGAALRHRDLRRARAPQRDPRPDGRRAHAQRGQPVLSSRSTRRGAMRSTAGR